MPATLITYANLGERADAGAHDVLPVIRKFADERELERVICRTNRGFKGAQVRSAIPLPLFYLIRLIEKVTGAGVPRRSIEALFDRIAAWNLGKGGIHLFHGGFFLPRSLRRSRLQGAIAVDITRTAHLAANAAIEREEYALLEIGDAPMPYGELAEKYVHLTDFDYVVAISDFVRKSYLEVGYPADRLFMASIDVDLKRYVPRPKADDTFRVLYAAYTTPLKGLHYLLDAWQELDLPDAELVIAGGFSEMPRSLYERYDRLIKGDPTIRQVGSVTNLEDYYPDASVFVFPSLTEGFGRVTLEAMACGIPVITTVNAQGIVEDGETGFVVPIRDHGALKEKIRYLYDNRDVARRMGISAREAAERKEGFAEEIYGIYQEILARESV